MKTENKNKYYNDEDEINFQRLNNFRKYNSELKKIVNLIIIILNMPILIKIILIIF